MSTSTAQDNVKGVSLQTSAKSSSGSNNNNNNSDNDITSVSSPSKGLSRIAPVKKLVHSFIARSKLEISSLHISSPDEHGLCAKGKIRLSHLGTGPLPLVGLKVKFKQPENVFLYRVSNDSDDDSSGKRTPLAKVKMEPLSLQPGLPGSVSSEVDLKLIIVPDGHSSFVNFVRDIVRSDPKTGTRMRLCAHGVQVKAYGLRFGGLKLDKDIILGGLGCLGGALIFDDMSGPSSVVQARKVPLTDTHDPTITTKKDKKRGKRESQIPLSVQTAGSTSTAFESKADSSANKRQLDISGLEIIGGDPQRGIRIQADITIDNPAISPSLTVEPGELRFVLRVADMCQQQQQQSGTSSSMEPNTMIDMGTLLIESAVLRPGPNKVKAIGFILLPKPPSDEQDTSSLTYRAYKTGQAFIGKILQSEAMEACAVATKYDAENTGSGASSVGWLAEAFQGARIDAKIPSLGSKVRLLDGAELRVEGSESGPSTPPAALARTASTMSSQTRDLKSSIARATLRNSFGVDIRVEELTVLACSSALYDEEGNLEILELGKIDTSRKHWPGVMMKKGGEPVHVSLPMEINSDPKVLIEILLKSAKKRHIDLGDPLTSLLEELRASHWSRAGWSAPPKSRPSSSIGTSRRTSVDHASNGPDPSDDLASLLSRALASLRVTAHVEAEATIGEYRVPGRLKFEQKDFPIALSTATASSLLPLVGEPFVRAMVDRAEVDVSSIKVVSMDDRGISAKIAIGLLNFGPLNALIRFVSGVRLQDKIDNTDGLHDVAFLECDEEIPITAGMESPVEVNARIVMPAGSGSRERFSLFVGRLLSAQSLPLTIVVERLAASSGGVHFDTSLTKSIELDGLGGFPDLRLDDFAIIGEASAPAEGVSMSVAAPVSGGQLSAIQFKGRTTIRNAGDLSLEINTLECDLLIDGAEVGQASMDNIEVKARGTCRVNVVGLIYAPSKEGSEREHALQALGSLIEALLAGKDVTIKIRGHRAWVPDQGRRNVSLVWLDEALRTFETTATLCLPGGVPVVEAVNVGSLEAVFPARGDMQIKVDEVTADYSIPFPIHIEIQSIEANVDIMYNGQVMGTSSAVQDQLEHVSQPSSPSRSQARQQQQESYMNRKRSSSSSGRIKLSLQAFELKTEHSEELGSMISHALQAGPDGTSQISLRGTANVKLKTVLGVLDVRVQLGKDHLIKVAGLDGLRTSPFQYNSLEVVAANKRYIQAKLDLHINNPSEAVRVRIPDSSLTMAAYFRDAYLGDVILGGDGKGINLNSGPIKLSDVEFRYRPAPSSEPTARPMLTQFLSGQTSTLNIRGHAKSSINPSLAQALSALNLDFDVRPIDRDILHDISVQLGLGVVTSNTVDARYALKNPIPLDIDILHLDVEALYGKTPFGTGSKSYSKVSASNRMRLPASQARIESGLVIKLSSPLDVLVGAFLKERGSIVLEVHIKAVLDINGFVIPNFEYAQKVPLHVTGLQGVAKLLRLI